MIVLQPYFFTIVCSVQFGEGCCLNGIPSQAVSKEGGIWESLQWLEELIDFPLCLVINFRYFFLETDRVCLLML